MGERLFPDRAELERRLLRRGVGRLIAGRSRCSQCRRTPLVGERIHLYEGGRMLCALCRRSEGTEPASSETVHGAEFGHAVRLRAA